MLDVVADQRADGGQDSDAEVDHGLAAQPRQAFEQGRRAREADAQQRRVELAGGHFSPAGRGTGRRVADRNAQPPGYDEALHIVHERTL